MLEIRRYQAKDSEVVKELYLAGNTQMGEMLTDAELRELMSTPTAPFGSDLDDIEGVYINDRGDFLVGTQDGEIVVIGAIRKYSEECGELKRLRVRRHLQRRGLAETMMRTLMARAEELGYKELVMDTIEENLPARCLFEKCGFTERGYEIKGPFHLIIYGKKLNKEGD